jgi:hypothetical protein
MTNYDKLIDSISNEIYTLNLSNESWNEDAAKKTSRRILEIVEEFQQNQSLLKKSNSLRASDQCH